VCGKS
jgi:hypothetical protein